MFVLCGLDCLEIPRLGGSGNIPQVWGVVLPGRPGGLVVLPTEDSQVGGPPGFGVMGGSGDRDMVLEEGY